MDINSIRIINFERDLKSADVIIKVNGNDSYMARIHKIDFLLQKIKSGRSIQSKTNYLTITDSLIVDEITEENMFDMVNNLLDEGDFHNVFKKV